MKTKRHDSGVFSPTWINAEACLFCLFALSNLMLSCGSGEFHCTVDLQVAQVWTVECRQIRRHTESPVQRKNRSAVFSKCCFVQTCAEELQTASSLCQTKCFCTKLKLSHLFVPGSHFCHGCASNCKKQLIWVHWCSKRHPFVSVTLFSSFTVFFCLFNSTGCFFPNCSETKEWKKDFESLTERQP